ncbi:MAG: tetratricopeptide repeat protein [Sphingomonas sp.]|uniref:SPOR domain-containing protein n=1 Tax=Sphingomonas sp. TaxID=28214 RepID=UPI0025ED099F|nr:tetratricopeptide repeat protein [Sphingomonas sp.]MBX9880815.1 tetratricopeptide repeat protein [Sphingomonas sp.]
MNGRVYLMLSASALLMGAGAVVTIKGTAYAGAPTETQAAKTAASYATKARQALAKRDARAAEFAEQAVKAAPQDAGYRALLGQAYLMAGRFVSARDALRDALTLAPNDARSALALSLAQIAAGDWSGARETLAAHEALIPAADRGLAIALAGDPVSAVELLSTAARAPGADAKTRQNLALALALAGNWPQARAVASLDVAPQDLDARIAQWAQFARPQGAADQVASLLGVVPVVDAGMPVALALAPKADVPAVATVETPTAEPTPPVVAAAEAAPVTVAEVAPAAAPVVAQADARPAIVFAPRQEVVQPLPVGKRAKAVAAKGIATPVASKPVVAVVATKAEPAPAKAPASGNFYLQLGAYENAAVARDGWLRATRRFAGFSGHTPSGMAVKTAGGSFYRLSLGGFARSEAVALCTAYRAKGGSCFVRLGAGDQLASWVKPGRELASR